MRTAGGQHIVKVTEAARLLVGSGALDDQFGAMVE